MANFSSWTFITGVITGLFLRSTDILPILGGFVLGLTVQKLPEIMLLENIPTFLKDSYYETIESINSALSGNQKKRKKHQITFKKQF